MRPERERAHTYSADVIEKGVLAKIVSHVLTTSQMPTVGAAVQRMTRRGESEESSLSKELEEVRRKLVKGTENLALADPENIPAFNRLLGEWRNRERDILARLSSIRKKETPESVVTIARLMKSLSKLEQADRILLASAIRLTIKRVSLRTTFVRYGGSGQHYFRNWSGVIEFNDDLHLPPVALTDDDVPNPVRWRKVIPIAEKHNGRIEKLRIVTEALGVSIKEASLFMAAGVAVGKFRKVEGQGWFIVPPGERAK